MLTMFSARKIRRDILCVTQAELARSLEVDQAAVSRWEKAEGKGVSVDARTQLALEALAMKFPIGMVAEKAGSAERVAA